ncbi:MAG: outer membrane beta-barrel protein [Bacteroidota bacterium]
MSTTQFRNRVYLFGIKAGLIALCLLAIPKDVSGQYQGGGNYNFFDFQQKPYYFGITLGINASRYTPFRSQDFLFSDSIRVVESINGPGFNLGIVTNLKIGKYFDFRFLPTLSFAERRLNYTTGTRVERQTQETVESVFVELPFHFRFKSAPYRDKRLFLIAGIKYNFDVASESRSRQADELVKISPHDFQVEYGFGVQFFLPYFIFSPEFKISHGIGNTLIFNPNLPESTVLEKVLSRAFTLSLHFEG